MTNTLYSDKRQKSRTSIRKIATKTPAAVITDNIEGHQTRNNRTAVAYIGTLMLRSVNYAKTSAE